MKPMKSGISPGLSWVPILKVNNDRDIILLFLSEVSERVFRLKIEVNWKILCWALSDESLLHIKTSGHEGEDDSWAKIEDKSWR